MTAEVEQMAGDDRPSAYLEDGVIVLRAHALSSCVRDHVLHLMGNEPLPTPDELQVRFDAGIKAEPHILARLEDIGWVFDADAQQREAHLKVLPAGEGKPAVIVRFHPDGVAVDPHSRELAVVECKALAKSSFTQAQTKGTGTMFGYSWQLSVMMHALKLPGVWVALCKNPDDGDDYTGELHIERVTKPPVSLGEIVKKAKVVRDAYVAGVVPECTDLNQYPCPFMYLRPEKEKDDSAFVTAPDMDAFEQLAAEYDVLTHVVASGSQADKERKKIKEQLLKVVGEAPGALGAGWRVSKIVSERPRMVATDEKYQTVSISVEKVG